MSKIFRYLSYIIICTLGILILIWLIKELREDPLSYNWLGDIKGKAAEERTVRARLPGDSSTHAPPPEKK